MDNMESAIVCPVCTLYLRPGMTLKNHLGSHPKQKVIDALVRLSGIDEIPKPSNVTSTQLDSATAGNSQISGVVNQSWNQGNVVNMPTNMPPLQGNHLFIYQQSMSSTTGPQQNMFNVNSLTPQYLIPTVFNPQMMPYVYQQQQQVIMASGACVPSPVRPLPAQEIPSNDLSNSDTPIPTQSPISDNIEDHEQQSVASPEIIINPEKSDVDEEIIENIEDETPPIITSDKEKLVTIKISEEVELTKLNTSFELKISEELDNHYLPENEPNNENNEEILGSPVSQTDSDWNLRVRSDLNKACQTQTTNTSPRSINQEDEYERPDYYFEGCDRNFERTNHIYIPTDGNNYTNINSVYNSTTNVLHSNENLDFVDIDGMHMVMNDFGSNQVISQVENFEGSAPERPGVLMTIGGMLEKDDFIDQRDESMSRESSNVNIRADERMPPRGELSGQESIGDTSDIAWNRANFESNSAMSTSYDVYVRDNWNASDSSDSVEVPPLQSRNPLPDSYQTENDDNETPTIVSFTGPPLNFKCSTCGEAFQCLKERQEHEAEKHPEKIRKINRIGSDIINKKVKKLVIKLKETKSEPENNFDNVFTNKLKLETSGDNEIEDAAVENPETRIDDNSIAPTVKIICSICECVLENPKALRYHKLQVHNINTKLRHKCMTCNEVFPNDYKFSEHLKVHPLECRLCGKLFYRRQNIQLHMRRHLGIRPYKCDICEKGFLTKQKLEEHRNIHTGDTPIKCATCDEGFRRHSNLVQHRNRHHLHLKKKVKDYICFCKEVFHSKKKLAWHQEIHDPKPKSCSQCSEKFIHQSSLTRHMRRAHNEKFLPQGHKSAENVECPICKGVYLKSSLDVHMRNHSGQRPFRCLICNKDFTTKWNLKLHKWTHASRVSKPFKCDQCKGAFIRESDYTAHMNSHKSIRPYTCNYCGAQFIRKYNCQRHVKEHENAKTFECKDCGKSFHRSYYLKDHMRIHSGIRPYSCHICGKTSTTKSNHNKHIQIHHAREPVSTEN